MKPPLPLDRVKELLRYDPSDGTFTWLFSTSRRVKTGDVAGSNRNGYIVIGIDGVQYLAHRVAWLYMTGSFPETEIDHKNGVRNDNRWDNLREASRAFNMQNWRHARSDNTVGVLGVRRMKGKFQANIRVDGRMVNCGTYTTVEKAHAAYVEAKRKFHPGNTL